MKSHICRVLNKIEPEADTKTLEKQIMSLWKTTAHKYEVDGIYYAGCWRAEPDYKSAERCYEFQNKRELIKKELRKGVYTPFKNYTMRTLQDLMKLVATQDLFAKGEATKKAKNMLKNGVEKEKRLLELRREIIKIKTRWGRPSQRLIDAFENHYLKPYEYEMMAVYSEIILQGK